MKGKSKMTLVYRSDEGDWVCCEDSRGKPHFFRTLRGKYEHFGRELEDKRINADSMFGDDMKRDFQPLTAEEIAFRKGFRACFAEIERMKRGKKK